MIHTLPIECLESDPRNVRRSYSNIEKLAQSIADHGLLQNLVVREREDKPGSYVIKAGERRYRALLLLCSRKVPGTDQPLWQGGVPCLVSESADDFVNLTENIQREDVMPWDLGYRYLELYEAGHDQSTIAARIGKSQTHVSMNIQIARGLAPKVVAALNRIGMNPLTQSQLVRLSKIYDEDIFEPDEDAQLKALGKMLEARPKGNARPRSVISERDRVYSRYVHLKRGFTVPSHAQPYVETVVRYLSGELKRLTFPQKRERNFS